MPGFFSKLREGSEFHSVELRAEGFAIRARPGRQPQFDRIAQLAIHKAGDRYAIFPQTNGACGWSSLVIVPMQ